MFQICARCSEPSLLTDAAGFNWCQSHRSRGDLINLGAKYGYPHLQCHPYVIAQGRYYWVAAAAIGIDEMVEQALSTIAYLETAKGA